MLLNAFHSVVLSWPILDNSVDISFNILIKSAYIMLQMLVLILSDAKQILAISLGSEFKPLCLPCQPSALFVPNTNILFNLVEIL
jgi:hypothetical protein